MITFIALFVLGAACVAATWALVHRVRPDGEQATLLKTLRPWIIKGLLLPVLFWALMNVGLSYQLQPFMPQVQWAKNNGSVYVWASTFLAAVGQGLFIICTYWGAVTLAWELTRSAGRLAEPQRGEFRALCRSCLLVMAIPALVVAFKGGWQTFGLAGMLLAAPIAGYSRGILRPKPARPMYARAIARLKFGKYTEAEQEVIRELEKREDDFDGWMMLAELYAVQFKDIALAEQTVLEICDQPRTAPSQLYNALHKLADWHLKIAGNPDAARRALQLVCDRLPGSHLANMTRLQMNQLPTSAQELREKRNPPRIPMPAIGDQMDITPRRAETALERKEALASAQACVTHLKHDPNHVPSREKLARLLAEQLGDVKQGLEQIDALLDMDEQPDLKRAEWMGLAAAWHLRYLQDTNTARALLNRIVEQFPQTPQALSARRRLELMNREARGQA